METVLNWITGDLSPAARVWFALSPALLATAYFLVGLAIYTVRWAIKGPYRDAEIESRGESVLVNMWIRQYFIWLMQPLWRLVVRSGVPPMAVTTLSVLISIAAGVAIAAGRFSLGGWLYIASGICDLLDGRLARTQNKVTKVGGVLDSILDRYSDAAILCGLAWFYRDTWVLVPVLLALVGSFLVSYVRAKGESVGVSIKVGLMQRPERVLYLGVACAVSPILEAILVPNDPRPLHRIAVAGVVLLAFTTQLTAFQRVVALVSALADSPIFSGIQGERSGMRRRIAVAAVATALDLGLVILLVTYTGMQPVLATAVGCVLGGVLNYTLGRAWAYRKTGAKLPQIGRYSFVSLTSVMINSGGVAVMLLLPGMDYRIAWILVRIAVAVAWNFPLHRDYVFVEYSPARTEPSRAKA